MTMLAKSSVLFVCLGNICRSTMAEIVFLDMITKRGIRNNWHVDSAATSRYEIGSSPDSRTIQVCKQKLGSNIYTGHIARQITRNDFKDFKYILCMDKSNLADLQSVMPQDATATVKLLGSYSPKGEEIIQDPYYGGIDGFEKAYEQVTRSLEGFLAKTSTL